MSDQKLYVAVRADLGEGLAAAQAVHAAFLYSQYHPEITANWMNDSQYLVIVSVPHEDALHDLAAHAVMEDIGYALWCEPDRAHEATAIALSPCAASRRLCANLPLHGRQVASV